MKLSASLSMVLLFAVDLTWASPVWADAAIAERILTLSQNLERAPNNQVLRLQRALAYAENNQPQLALADIRIAETVGNSVDAAFAHGVLLYRDGNHAAARPYFDRYLQAYPMHLGALDYRARLLRDIGENRQAVADYETLMRLNGALDPGYYVATARLMAGLPERGVDQALALLDNRLAEIGPVTALQRYAIELEMKRGNVQGAIDRMTMLNEKLRATPEWQVEIAELLMRAGKSEEALPYLKVAQEQLQSGRLPVHRALLATVLELQAQAQHMALHTCGASLGPPCPPDAPQWVSPPD